MSLPKIAVTTGDPVGIGPEVCLHLLQNEGIAAQCVPIIFGDKVVLEQAADQCGLPKPQKYIAGLSEADGPCVLDMSAIGLDEFETGTVNAATGYAGFVYVENAIDAALGGQVAGVTTGPLNKEALRVAGISFPGHTEIFAEKTHTQNFCMMQYSAEVRCVFATTHVPYSEVPALLTKERILDVLELGAQAMRRIGCISGHEPKIGVLGLNPHAGEHGLFGEEEEQVIIPAIEAARAKGFEVEGPIPPDTAFIPAKRRATDFFVCMYHDQGHIPLKALAFDNAVNTTLGLPIIRTSVDHGTALDIAGQGKANPGSLFEAVKLALKFI